jgi:hypothetical protein
LILTDPETDSVHTQHSQYQLSGGSHSTGQSQAHTKLISVKKSTKKKNGGKVGYNLAEQAHNKLLPQPTNPNKAPNLSRKLRGLKLYAFPSFDKCDSLVFFPNSMSRYLNSGDYYSLGQLMASHLHRNCAVRISPNGNPRISALMFIKMFEVMNEAHPDSVLCVHTTKVIENSIHARMYFKFTDSQVINASMANRTTGDMFQSMFALPRSDRFRDNMNFTAKTSEERVAITQIVDSNVDLVVYGKVDFRLCFDDCKKVTDIDFMCEFTSLSTTQICALGADEQL